MGPARKGLRVGLRRGRCLRRGHVHWAVGLCSVKQRPTPQGRSASGRAASQGGSARAAEPIGKAEKSSACMGSGLWGGPLARSPALLPSRPRCGPPTRTHRPPGGPWSEQGCCHVCLMFCIVWPRAFSDSPGTSTSYTDTCTQIGRRSAAWTERPRLLTRDPLQPWAAWLRPLSLRRHGQVGSGFGWERPQCPFRFLPAPRFPGL